jgi:hypothetical protein
MIITALILLVAFRPQDSSLTGVVQSSAEIFESARSLSVSPGGDLFCIDQQTSMVYRLSHDLSVAGTVGGKGWGQTEFDLPTDLTSSFLLDVYVTDHRNRRIQRFDARLRYIGTIDEPSLSSSVGSIQPLACAVSRHGDLFILDSDGIRILKVSSRKRFEREFGMFRDGAGALTKPVDIDITGNDEVAVLDQNMVKVYDVYGNFLRTIMLPGSAWSSISAFGDRLVVTSPDVLLLLSADGRQRQRIDRQNIFGLPSGAVMVDAALLGDFLYILTGTGLYRCSIQ